MKKLPVRQFHELWGDKMLLETNDVELLIINLDKIDSKYDNDLIKVIKKYRSCLLASSGSRFSYLICHPEVRTRGIPNNVQFFVGGLNIIDISIRSILKNKDLNVYQAVYLTGDFTEYETVSRLGLSVIVLSEDNSIGAILPDLWAYEIDMILDCLENKFTYYGEHKCVFPLDQDKGLLVEKEMHHLINPEIKANFIFMGRYFNQYDRRRPFHPYTQKIKKLKNGYHKDFFAHLLRTSINFWFHDEKPIFTLVPPRPGEVNKLEEVFKTSLSNMDSFFVKPQLLKCKSYYPPQKEAGNHTDRFKNVFDKFEVTQAMKGHVVIFDDIVTSGATALECARMLYMAGAEKVSVISFAAVQPCLKGNLEIPCESPECIDGKYVLKFRHSDGVIFFGCSNYPDCRSNPDYETIRRKYNIYNHNYPNTGIIGIDNF